MRDLEREFWATRQDAKEAYKKYKEFKGSGEERAKLMRLYNQAWQKHQAANMAQFTWEALNG